MEDILGTFTGTDTKRSGLAVVERSEAGGTEGVSDLTLEIIRSVEVAGRN